MNSWKYRKNSSTHWGFFKPHSTDWKDQAKKLLWLHSMVCNISWQNLNILKFLSVKFQKHLSSRLYVNFVCVSHLSTRVYNSNSSLVAYNQIFAHIFNLRLKVIEASTLEHSQPRVIKALRKFSLRRGNRIAVPRYCQKSVYSKKQQPLHQRDSTTENKKICQKKRFWDVKVVIQEPEKYLLALVEAPHLALLETPHLHRQFFTKSSR